MSEFNGFDMTDLDAYEAGYSYLPCQRKHYIPSQCYDYWKTKAGVRESCIASNVRSGIWFTGEKITNMTDEHLENALNLSRRKFYHDYVDALEAEKHRRMKSEGGRMSDCRKDITAMLSEQLEKQILARYPLWAAEVKLGDGDRYGESVFTGRVDYMAFEPLNMSHSLRSIEAGVLHVFEVKSCMDDLRSGHGMNRVGDVNWLVCTKELWAEIIEKDVDVSAWKPLVYGWVEDGKFNWSKYESYEVIGRKLPLVQAIWMMLTASGKKVVR